MIFFDSTASDAQKSNVKRQTKNEQRCIQVHMITSNQIFVRRQMFSFLPGNLPGVATSDPK